MSDAVVPKTPEGAAPWRDAWPALAAAVAFGASTPAVKAWLRDLPSLFASGWLYLTSGVGLLLWRVLGRALGRATVEAPLRRDDLPWFAGAILCGGVIAPYAYVRAVTANPGHVTSMLLNLEVVLTAVVAVGLFREALDGRRVAGIALIVLGSAVYAWVSEARGAAGLEGPAWAALACLGWGLDNNLTRRVSAKDPVQIACVKGLVGGTVAIALSLGFAGAPAAGADAYALGALVGFVCYGLSLVLFIRGLRVVGAARTSALFGTNTFVGALLSALFLGEAVSPWAAAVAVAIAGGVALVTLERHEHEHAHDATEHEHVHVHDPRDPHHRHAHRGDEGPEPHSHPHRHEPLVHAHPHRPDLHHRHSH